MELDTTAGGVILPLLLALLVFWIAQKNHFFKAPPPSISVPVIFLHAFVALLLYLLFAFIILPILLVILATYASNGNWRSFEAIPHLWKGYLQIFGLWAFAVFLGGYTLLLKAPTSHFIFWGEGSRSWPRFFKGIGMGALTCLISYPFVLFVGVIVKWVTTLFWGKIEAEQLAVKQLKSLMGDHTLFPLMVITVIFIVPFIEELLFRGFLQNMLKRYLGRNWAIPIAAILFAFAHFSVSQGLGNLQILSTLLVLAFFLGYIYERERTLWASYGLHMIFNGFNILMIFYA